MSGPLATIGAAALADRHPADAESALVGRLRARDPVAVGLAYDLHHRAVRAFARRLVGDDQTAEDLVQDVFVALPAAIRRFNQQSALRTFLIGVAVNHARHHLRSAARRRRTLAQLAQAMPQAPPPAPDEASERRHLAGALARALDDLPLKQRLVFVLCEVEHRTSAEAAALLAIPDATVRTRLHHARERLRARLIAEGLE
jgi:RNA polymerase sigma-70 factor (ECF subfamily)